MNLKPLKDAAIRAGGGSYKYIRTSPHSRGYIVTEAGTTVVNIDDGDVPAKHCAFIEQADPRTVLALIEELEQAREERDNNLRRAVRAELALGQVGELSDSVYNDAVADGVGLVYKALKDAHTEMTRSLFSRIGRSANIQILENLIPSLKRMEIRIRTAKERVK